MISALFQLPETGIEKDVNLATVPRIGEKIRIEGSDYQVTEVFWNFDLAGAASLTHRRTVIELEAL